MSSTIQKLGAKSLNKTGGKNRFRFRNFAERVADVDVNIAHQIRAKHELALRPDKGELSTFFEQTLNECRDIDLTRDFRSFCEDVISLSQNMALLVHSLPQIVASLLKHIRVPFSTLFYYMLILVVDSSNSCSSLSFNNDLCPLPGCTPRNLPFL
jgi:hypothetical protein